MRLTDDPFTGDLFAIEQHGPETARALVDLRKRWKDTISDDGGCCPVCGRWGKVYRYRLTQTLALSLKWIADHGDEDGWTDVQKTGPRWMLRSKTYPLLTHWRMIESRDFRSGIWRVNEYGRRFINGADQAHRAVFVYDDRVMGVEEERVTFRACFGVKFNFDELMSANFNWANLAIPPRGASN